MKKPLLTFVTLLLHFIVIGQNTAHTLLWRISGKGLAEPSYLFGTMHLTDKKVFHLGDSLYKALENTHGFAAELDMNRLGMQMVNKLMKDKEEAAATESIKIKDAVSPELWEMYKEPLQEKFFKSADKLTLDDLDEMEASLQTEIFRKGEMQTFLDAYLFGIARKQGKWVGGLEDLADQMEHLNSDDVEEKIQMALFDDKYYRNEVDRLIKIYLSQQLDSIDVLYNEEQSGKKDHIMIKRNLKMARMMDSLTTVRSTFFAVGAAHLPGDSGVISLLRSRGFTVSPVFASKKISPDKYVIKSKDIPWETVQVKDHVYKLQMPGVADALEYFEAIGLDMKIFFDLAFMKMYMTLNIDLPQERRKLGPDSLYSIFIKRYADKGEIGKVVPVRINGIDGKEFSVTTDDGEMRMQLFIPGLERVILNAVFCYSKKSLNDEDSKKFFASFIYDPAFKRPEAVSKEWSVLHFPQHTFSIEMPAQPRMTKDVKSSEGKAIYEFQHVDLTAQVFYGITLSVAKEGMYETIDSSYFETLKNQLATGFKDFKVLDSSLGKYDSYPAYSLTVYGKTEGEYVETKVLSVVRGNRNYYLYAVYLPGDESRKSVERYMKSFKLLPYQYRPEWITVSDPTGAFSAVSPFPLKKIDLNEDDIHPHAQRFIIHDTVVAGTVFIDRTILPEWMTISSDTAFLNKRSKQYVAWQDTVINYHLRQEGNLNIADFTVVTPGTYIEKRVKLVLNGSELYEIFTHLTRADLSSTYERLFRDFKVTKPQTRSKINGSTAAQLETVLQKADKSGVEEVKNWWNELLFTQSDIPYLQKMSLGVYADFDTTYYSNLNARIINKLQDLDTLHSTMEFIRKNYTSLPVKNEYLKPFFISYLSRIKTKESYDLIRQLLEKEKLAMSRPVYFMHSLYDSIQLTASLFPAILKQAGDMGMGEEILSLTNYLVDSGYLTKEQIKPYGPSFIAAATKAMKVTDQEIEDEAYNYYDHIRILGSINTPESHRLLNRFAKLNDRGIKYHTVIAQLSLNLPANSKTIYTLATTDEYRYSLYESLKRLNKLALFPSLYKNQRELGQSKVHEAGTEEDYAPTIISHKGERMIEYKGKKSKFYLYNVVYDAASGESYLGIAGPFSIDTKNLSSSYEATGIYFREYFDAKKMDTHFKAYLEGLENPEDDELQPPPPPMEMIEIKKNR
jgi:uncharacterized protein YbaP (TraB family)